MAAHTPKSVISKNFNLAPEVFAHLPEKEKYIFQGDRPGPVGQERPTGSSARQSTRQFSFGMLDMEPTNTTGGQVRIVDSGNFPESTTVAAAHVDIEPGALREMHWHPTADEWTFFIGGRARMTLFGAKGTARTFTYMAGDVAVVPKNYGHFIENIGDEPVELLEIFRADRFRDLSLFQWMGDTPKRLVVDHLFADDRESGDRFWDQVKSAEKQPVRMPGKEVADQMRIEL